MKTRECSWNISTISVVKFAANYGRSWTMSRNTSSAGRAKIALGAVTGLFEGYPSRNLSQVASLYGNQNMPYIRSVPPRYEGRFGRVVTKTWGGMRWTRERRRLRKRTVKPCGPVPPTLGSSCAKRSAKRRRLTSPVLRGDHGAAVNPLRRECRTCSAFPVYLV